MKITWQFFRRPEILVAPVSRHLLSLVVQHARARPLVVRPPQLLDLILPVALLAQQLVDFVVEVADPELAETGVLDLGHLFRDLANNLGAPFLASVEALALGSHGRPPTLVLVVLAELGGAPSGQGCPTKLTKIEPTTLRGLLGLYLITYIAFSAFRA